MRTRSDIWRSLVGIREARKVPVGGMSWKTQPLVPIVVDPSLIDDGAVAFNPNIGTFQDDAAIELTVMFRSSAHGS